MRLIEILVLTLSVGTVLAAELNNEQKLIAATRSFAATMYKELIKTQLDQNVIFSSISIQTAMSLVASAADDDGADVISEIINSLNFTSGKVNRDTAFQSLLKKLNDTDDDFQLFDATKIYFQNESIVNKDFTTNAQIYYGAEIEGVNFRDNVQTSKKINDWVKKKTNDRIIDMISPNELSGYTDNLMINSIYLRGKWAKPFLEENNVQKTFKGPHGNKIVTMMYNDNYTHGYYEDKDAQYLKLEILRPGDAFMVFVLPKKEQGLGDLENNTLNFIKEDDFSGFQSRIVNVTLPKFSFGNNMKLKPALKNIGVKKLFEWGYAVKGLGVQGHPLVVISEVAQKAVIDVNEWGVTAGVASDVQPMVDSSPLEPKNFTADHPFFFYITVGNAVIFAGRVMEI